jgi:hypothetical protein
MLPSAICDDEKANESLVVNPQFMPRRAAKGSAGKRPTLKARNQ